MRAVSSDMEMRKVSNSKRDFQGHSRSLVLLPFDKPHPHVIYYHSTSVIMPLSCIVFEILSVITYLAYRNLEVTRPWINSIREWSILHTLVLDSRHSQSAYQIWSAYPAIPKVWRRPKT